MSNPLDQGPCRFDITWGNKAKTVEGKAHCGFDPNDYSADTLWLDTEDGIEQSVDATAVAFAARLRYLDIQQGDHIRIDYNPANHICPWRIRKD